MCRRKSAIAPLLGFVLLASAPARAVEPFPLIELETRDGRYEGRVAGQGRDWCILFDRSGRMHTIDLGQVSRFRRLAPDFRPLAFGTLRAELQKEFGRDYEVATSRHYLVVAPAGRAAEYVDLFEQSWRRFHLYFAVRGFPIDDPEFPLIAVVLKDQRSFLEYARRERATVSHGILGYYWSTHNRVILFEPDRRSAARPGSTEADAHRRLADRRHHAWRPGTGADSTADFSGRDRLDDPWRNLEDDAWSWAFATSVFRDGPAVRLAASPGDPASAVDPETGRPVFMSGVDSGLRETIVHEATHQLGYNLGLHNRLGRNARWVVEGLATVFETPGMESGRSGSAGRRAHPGWRAGFRKLVSKDRPADALQRFIQDDSLFDSDMTAAYSQAWAVTFWLIETRPREYGRFLRTMASPEVAHDLTPQRRLEVFQQAFGTSLTLLDAELLRFHARLD